MRVGLPLAVAGTTSDDLYNLGQRCAYADSDAMLAPLPVEALLCGAEGDKNVERVAAVHTLQVRLQHSPLFSFILNQIANF